MNPFDRVKSPLQPPPGEEDDLIDLNEVMEDEEPLELTDEVADEVAAEVVLDFRDGTDGLAALKAPAAPPEEAPPAPAAAPPGRIPGRLSGLAPRTAGRTGHP